MLRAARFANLLLSSMAGAMFVGTRFAASPSTRGFAPSTYVEYQQATVRNLIPVMAVLMPGAALSSLTVLLLQARAGDRSSPAFLLTLVGLLSQVAMGGTTQAVNMPINRQVLTWPPKAPPEGWEKLRDRWESAHTLRAAAAIAGQAALFAAALQPAGKQERG